MIVTILSFTLLLKKVQSCHQFIRGFQHGESKNGFETRMKVLILLIGLAFLPPLISGIRKFISIHVLLIRYLKIGVFNVSRATATFFFEKSKYYDCILWK